MFIAIIYYKIKMSESVLQRVLRSGVQVQLQSAFQLTVPLKDPSFEVDLGVVVYGNYNVTTTVNTTLETEILPFEFDINNTVKRRRKKRECSIQRQIIYMAIEILLERSLGLSSGRACLLRSICEHALNPFYQKSLFEEMIHILLTPSTTFEKGKLHVDYLAAEKLGREGQDCNLIFPGCPESILDIISTFLNL